MLLLSKIMLNFAKKYGEGHDSIELDYVRELLLSRKGGGGLR